MNPPLVYSSSLSHLSNINVNKCLPLITLMLFFDELFASINDDCLPMTIL